MKTRGPVTDALLSSWKGFAENAFVYEEKEGVALFKSGLNGFNYAYPIQGYVTGKLAAMVESYFAPFSYDWIIETDCEGKDHVTHLQMNGTACGMEMDLKAISKAESKNVYLVDREDLLQEWVEAVGKGFSIPHKMVKAFGDEIFKIQSQTLFVSYIDEELASGMLCSIDGQHAFFSFLATVPAKRRRGAACALLKKALEYVASKGCSKAYLQGSPMGKTLYSSVGFQDVSIEYEFWKKA